MLLLVLLPFTYVRTCMNARARTYYTAQLNVILLLNVDRYVDWGRPRALLLSLVDGLVLALDRRELVERAQQGARSKRTSRSAAAAPTNPTNLFLCGCRRQGSSEACREVAFSHEEEPERR